MSLVDVVIQGRDGGGSDQGGVVGWAGPQRPGGAAGLEAGLQWAEG